MKYAIISDIHANPVAFKSVLDDIRRQKADRIICLGDVTGYGYDAVESCVLAKENCDVWLLGNHDAACAGVGADALVRGNPHYDFDIAERKELGRDRLAEIRELPYTFTNKHFTCVHGDFIVPQDFGYVLTADDAWRNFCACDRNLMFIGHTHEAKVWKLNAKAELETAGVGKIDLDPDCRYIVNVGSVGYPRHDLFSSYAIYDAAQNAIDLRTVDFDFPGYMRSFEDRGLVLPTWTDRLLRIMTAKKNKRKLKLK